MANRRWLSGTPQRHHAAVAQRRAADRRSSWPCGVAVAGTTPAVDDSGNDRVTPWELAP